MQNYKEINGNDYVKDSRTTINETMQSIQSMNSGTVFPTTNLFEGMKCYRTDLKKTYTLTDVENATWVEDAHATLADTATKLQTPRTLSLTGKAAGSATFDGSANAAINVTSVNADTASKLSTARKINITGNATGSAAFDGSGDVIISTTVNESKHAAAADNSNKLGGYPLNAESIGGHYSTVPAVKTDGVMEIGKYIDWHATEGGTEDFSSRWTAETNGTVSVGTINGTLKGNADSATNADKLDGYHENSFLRYRGATDANGEDTLWNQIGIKEYNNVLPESLTGTYEYGAVVSFPSLNDRLDIWYDCYASDKGTGLYYRTGWQNDKRAWARLLDSNNYTKWAPTKTGSGASGTWDISITGNATTATTATTATNATNAGNADTVDGIHADSMFYNKGDWGADNWGTIGAYQVNNNSPVSDAYGWGQVISSSTNDGRFQLYASHQYGGNGRLRYRTGWDNDKSQPWNTILDSENYNLFSPTKTGGGASGTWGISITGNAATATNADTVDGYHASDIINRISAANTGGIVAASLTENGYVKFANGLILQWGNASGENEEADNSTTFPIAFPSTCFVVLLTSKRYIASNRLLRQSKTGFTWTVKSGLISWAALGM